MSVNALVTMEEYWQTSYSPDREYVDGEYDVCQYSSIVTRALTLMLTKISPF